MSPGDVIAVLGLGEAGTAIATDLVAAGVTVRGWDPVREAPAGVEPAAGERDAVRGDGIVLSLNAAAAAARAAFADVALLGPVPGKGVRTPALGSGPGAERVREGLAAAVGESLAAGRRLGCEGWLHAELEAALTAADARYLTRLIEGSRAHSGRRAEEMAAAVALLEELGVEPRVARASEAWLRSLGHSQVGG